MRRRLKEKREALGFMSKDVAVFLKVVQPSMDAALYSKIENGHALPTPEVLKELTWLLQAPETDLFNEVELAVIHGEKPPQSLETQAVVALIPTGKENAIPRSYLVARSGLADRHVRWHIAKAIELGEPIMNDQDGAGYYIADDMDDIERRYRAERARALAILKKLSAMRRVLKEAGRDV